jgi:hypothetical protein
MRSSFQSNSIKTAFQYRSDLSLTTSFSTLMDTLPDGKVSSLTTLKEYKDLISTKNYRGSYKRTILGIVDRLVEIISSGGTTIHTFDPVVLATNVRLTINTLYQDYLDGINDGTGIDPVMIIILNEIKSASIS